VQLYGEKPDLAAVPGTSNHGWGLAVDLCGGIERFGTPQYGWMLANAGRFGFVHPGWADPGNGREEPWHWEYTGT
jgi:LAS superfamily LD-carboxypeptidase LdcB